MLRCSGALVVLVVSTHSAVLACCLDVAVECGLGAWNAGIALLACVRPARPARRMVVDRRALPTWTGVGVYRCLSVTV